MTQKLNTLSLADIAPSSILTDQTTHAIIKSLDPELQAISCGIDQTAILSRIDDLPEQLLDALAWQWHADFYDLAPNLTMKREHVKKALMLHMKKGTAWAIIEGLKQLDIEAEFVPWWISGEEPYTFRLRAIIGGEFYKSAGKDALIKNIVRAVEENKSARSLMTRLETVLRDKQSMTLHIGSATLLSGHREIHLEPPKTRDISTLHAIVPILLDGHAEIHVHHPPKGEGKIFCAGLMIVSGSKEIGVDLQTMNELLLRFEDRIFTRLDDTESRLNQAVQDIKKEMNLRFDEIERLLKWAGDDEEL